MEQVRAQFVPTAAAITADTTASSAHSSLATDELTFDYIIVGGGTAGLTVASRLAEDEQINVCVIEAGEQKSDPLIDIPGLYGKAVGNPEYDWSFMTIAQPELNGRGIKSFAGKVLGGSSAINYLVRMRASATEYDAWSKFGDGWDWDNLLRCFKKSEHHMGPTWGTDAIFPGICKEEDEEARFHEPQYCGYDGPVQHTYNAIYTDVMKPFVKALRTLGIKPNRSPDYGNSTGIFNIGTAVDRSTGKRSYAANTYYKPGTKKNLVVLTNRCVTKVIFATKQGQDPLQAFGVQFIRTSNKVWASDAGASVTIRAKQEVILSAGSYNTPKLLELSGVGKKDMLEKLGIKCLIDLPGVGENLQEHIYVPSDFVVKEDVFTLDLLRTSSKYRAEQQLQYTKTKDGAYATTVSAYGFIKLSQILSWDEIKQLKDELDKEISATTNVFHRKQYNIQKDYLDKDGVGDIEVVMVPHVFATNPPAQQSYVGLIAGLPRSYSRGSVHISNIDPNVPPTIDPHYLMSTFDSKCLVRASQFIRKISETEPFKSQIKEPSSPPSSVKTQKDFEDYVRGHAASVQHPIGTAAMAPKDLGGVVDSNLLVYGTKNLRVVDMSIAPIHIAAHLLDTAYAIGERAYELIIGEV